MKRIASAALRKTTPRPHDDHRATVLYCVKYTVWVSPTPWMDDAPSRRWCDPASSNELSVSAESCKEEVASLEEIPLVVVGCSGQEPDVVGQQQDVGDAIFASSTAGGTGVDAIAMGRSWQVLSG